MRVLIVDDHALFADSIRPAVEDLGATEILTAATAAEALVLARLMQPDVILLDLGLPDRSGLSVGREILDTVPAVKLIALTSLRDENVVREALRSGFSGYVTKDASVRRFMSSVRAILGGTVVAPGPARFRPGAGVRTEQERAATMLSQQLTPRELEVLSLLVEGRSGSEIARRLSISQYTVRTHTQSILSKLQVHSRLEAAAFAVRHHLVEVRRRPAV